MMQEIVKMSLEHPVIPDNKEVRGDYEGCFKGTQEAI